MAGRESGRSGRTPWTPSLLPPLYAEGERAIMQPSQVGVSFEEVAGHFTQESGPYCAPPQDKQVMLEHFGNMASLGPLMAKPDLISQMEERGGLFLLGSEEEEGLADSSTGTTTMISWPSFGREEEKMAGMRGVSWKRDEILDLLAIWGDKKIQTALRESHRNKDVYEDVAKAMVERGHKRTWEECRTKTKGLRLAYKQVLSHNSKPGNSFVTCPYYEQLDQILKGDASVKSRRVSQSYHRQNAPRREAHLQEVTLDPLPSNTEERGEVREAAPSTSGSQDGANDMETHTEESFLEDPGETMIDPDVAEGTVEASQQEEAVPTDLKRRHPEEMPPGDDLTDLSPSSYLALMRGKRKKVSSVQRVGEMMMDQSSREHRAVIEASREENRELIAEMRAAREEERKVNQTVCSLFREALGALTKMSRAIMMSRTEAACERVPRPVEEHRLEPEPSTSGVGALAWGEPRGEDSQVVPPPPETPTPTKERCAGTLGIKLAEQPLKLSGFRTRSAVKAKKP